MQDDDFSDRRMVFDAVRDVAGEAGVITIHHRFGGRHLTIPCARVYGTSPLAQALGKEAEAAIARRLRVIDADNRVMAGLRIYVPRIDDEARAVRKRTALFAGAACAARNNAIRKAAVDAVVGGMSRREASARFGINLDTIQRGMKQRMPDALAPDISCPTALTETVPSP